MESLATTPQQTALLLMDFHVAIVGAHGEPGHAAVTAAGQALSVARQAGCSVFHVLPNYRAGYPELPATGQPFDAVKAAGLFLESNPVDGLPEVLKPRADEPVCSKCRYSPFYANDLLHLLRLRGVDTVVLAGLATSGVVLSAVRDAWDRDLRVVVLSDACADPDPEVHHVLTQKMFPNQALVVSVADWAAGL